jgi:hypothetical protein
MPTPSRTTERRSRIAACAVVLAIASWTATAALAQQAPAVPSTTGIAAGTVQLGKSTVALKHAYALGPMDMGGLLYQVVLTDSPIPPDALAKELARGGQSMLKSGKLSGVTLLIDDTGSVRNMVPYVGDLRGSKMLASAGRLESFAFRHDGTGPQGPRPDGGAGLELRRKLERDGDQALTHRSPPGGAGIPLAQTTRRHTPWP